MPIAVPDMDCDERYFSYVVCGGVHFLFSRREFSCCDMWDTVVRTAQPGQPFGPSAITLHHSLTLATHLSVWFLVRRGTEALVRECAHATGEGCQVVKWNFTSLTPA